MISISTGCASRDRSGRQAVAGTVTLDGQPIIEGAILLEPPTPQAGGTAVGATIRRGSFAIARDHGPTPGKYRVRLYASAGVQAAPGAGQTDRTRRPMSERLPSTYNTDSKMLVEVTDGGSNRLRFDLHSEAAD